MCSRWSFPFVLLSLIGSVTASSLRERNTLSVAPRTAYHFSNNYADKSCSQLVSGHMEVRYANTTSFYSRPCAAQQTIYGTVYYKEVLAEFDKFESCTAGLVGSLYHVTDTTCSTLVGASYFKSDVCTRDGQLVTYDEGKNTWTISIYPGDTCGKSGATVTPIPYLLYGGCLPVGHGDLNYAAFIAAPSLSCSPTFAPTVTPSAVPTKNKERGDIKSCPKI